MKRGLPTNGRELPKPPGSVYDKRGRYYWSGRLSGEIRARARAVKAPDQAVALRATPENLQIAYRVIWRWIEDAKAVGASGRITVAQLRALYLVHCREYYRRKDGTLTGEHKNVELATRLMASKFGHLPADAIDKTHIRQLRDQWITDRLVITTINKWVNIIKRMYNWASGEQDYLPATAYYNVAVIKNLVMWRTKAKLSREIKPADDFSVDYAMRFMPATFWRMVMLHRLAGFRSTELCIMRPCDIDRGGAIWLYRPAWSKEEHKGVLRVIPLGPIAQELLSPLLGRPKDQYCFRPAEVMGERWNTQRSARKSPVQPSQRNRKKLTADEQFLDRYDRTSYYHAVRHAVVAAVRHAAAEKITVTPWHPHQLRHSFITKVKRRFGAETARASGGHASLDATEIYIERDMLAATQVASEIG